MRADLRDFAIREVGCVVARLRGIGYVPCEKHHILTTGRHGTGKRRGEAFTVGLNPWSHRGIAFGEWSVHQCRDKLGPSYAREPRKFRELYPDDLLLTEQNRLIDEWKKNTMGAGQ